MTSLDFVLQKWSDSDCYSNIRRHYYNNKLIMFKRLFNKVFGKSNTDSKSEQEPQVRKRDEKLGYKFFLEESDPKEEIKDNQPVKFGFS